MILYRYGRTGKYRQRSRGIDLLFEEAKVLNDHFIQLIQVQIVGDLWEQTLGARWEKVGFERPKTGSEISNAMLATALEAKQEFTREEVDNFEVPNLTAMCYIKVGEEYFKAVVEAPGELIRGPIKRPQR